MLDLLRAGEQDAYSDLGRRHELQACRAMAEADTDVYDPEFKCATTIAARKLHRKAS